MIGLFSKTTDSNFVEAAGLSGLDFIILDQEHGPASLENIHHHVRACRSSAMKAIVRVKGPDASAIGSALDCGADGVQVPNIATADQARQVVEAARFHPMGKRGVCRFVRAAAFGGKEKELYFQEENTKWVILQVEGVEGIHNIREILQVDGYDILFVGPYDLSQSLGLPGQVDHPEVMKQIALVAEQAKAYGKTAGIFVDQPRLIPVFAQAGFSYIAYSVDIHLFQQACREVKRWDNTN